MPQVKVSENTREVLRLLSIQEGKTMGDITDKAVEDYRRNVFLEDLSDDYRLLRENPRAWKEHEEETALWNNALMDGPDNE